MSPKGRKNPADLWMPPRVYRGKSAFEWRPKAGGAVRLCSLKASKDEVWKQYSLAKLTCNQGDSCTVATMLDNFFTSQHFKKLKSNTQKDYRQCEKKIRTVFGEAAPEAITAPIVRQFMDKRGEQSETRANREKALLSIVWAWNFERGNTVMPNPCPNVRDFKEKARERYVTDEEFDAVFTLAPLYVRVAMEIAYLCAARQGDVLELRWGKKGQREPENGQEAVILEQGIYIRQEKTGLRQIKLWSPRLKAAVKAAKGQKSTITSVYVIHNQQGQRYTASGFKAIFRKVLLKWLGQDARANHPSWFTFHDLKAKGVSDYEQGDKQEFSGHSTRSQMERYNRRIQEVPAHDPDYQK